LTKVKWHIFWPTLWLWCCVVYWFAFYVWTLLHFWPALCSDGCSSPKKFAV